MQGRKPKPTALKDLHGSTEPRNPDEPVPTIKLEAISAPDHFDDEHRAVWIDALQNAPPGMLKMIDGSVLEVWVVARVLHRKAVRAQSRYALVIPAPQTKFPIQSPYLAIINRQALVMMRAASELGFSPTARPRVGAALGGADLSSPNGASNAAGEESIDAYLARTPTSAAIN